MHKAGTRGGETEHVSTRKVIVARGHGHDSRTASYRIAPFVRRIKYG